jgi:hypothetical protein
MPTRSVARPTVRPPRHFLAAATALVLLAAGLHATVVAAVSLAEMVTASRLIVEGTVVEQVSELNGQGVLTTRVVIKTGEVFKDTRAAPLFAGEGRTAFRLLGGDHEGLRLTIPGMPTFEIGDRAVFLLAQRSSKGFRFPVGLGQGVLRIRTDDAGTLRVSRDLDGTVLVQGDGSQTVASAIPTDYDTLADRLRALVAENR